MNLKRYDTLFEEYLTKIVLTSDQADNIDEKLEETLSLFLGHYGPDLDIYSQGSYAMGTTVRPLTREQSPSNEAGEYDVDIVLERGSWQSAKDTLRSIRNNLLAEYSAKVDNKERESCERVLHDKDDKTEIGFHVDYVPIKPIAGSRNAARRSEDIWFPSDTKRLIEWFAETSDYLTYMPTLILVLKRMRDNAGLTDILSSICITALVGNFYEEKSSYAEDLMNILDSSILCFDVPHTQLSITLGPLEDDLADRITPEQQKTILTFLVNARRLLELGFRTENLEVLRQVLSTSFPADISSFPNNLEALRNRGWGIETDGSLRQVEISEHGEQGSFITKVRKRFYGTGEHLIFHANEYDWQLYGIRWQVLNADGAPERRGNLFEARGAGGGYGTSSNKFINHETEQYSGEHWIKYYVYDKNSLRVVEIGTKFFVEVNV